MFKATIADANLLVDSIATIAELIDEGVFKIDSTGISMIAADRAMVAVVDYKLAASAFEKFETDKEYDIGLNITNFISVLKRAGQGDKITLSLQDAKLEITIEGASRRKFVVPLLDLGKEEVPPIDQLEFTAKAKVNPEVIRSGLDDAEVISDSVLFEALPEKFSMRADGDVSFTQLELEKGNQALLELTSAAEVKARYPLDYLKKMIKASKVAESVLLQWAKDYPMKLEFSSADKVKLNFILAPRVVEE